jgi:hypothetical protein
LLLHGATIECARTSLHLQVSTYQMVVLLLFNDAEQLSYREIAEATEIPALELKRSLQSLACAKGESVVAGVAVLSYTTVL